MINLLASNHYSYLKQNLLKMNSNFADVEIETQTFPDGEHYWRIKNPKAIRGKLEITDLNNEYLKEKRLNVIVMRRGNAWLDAGTPDSLMDAGQFVQIIEKRQGLKIACIEEIAYRRGFMSDEKMLAHIASLKDGNYKKYLEKVYEERHEF